MHVNCFSKTADGKYLIGTRGQGLFVSDDLEDFDQVGFNDPALNNNFMIQSTYFIHQFNNEALWIGSDMGALILTSVKKGALTIERAGNYFNSPDLNIPRKVLGIHRRGDDLWIGTQQQGLFLYRLENDTFNLLRRYTASSEGGIENNRISNLLTDSDGKFWIGTYNGLYQYREADNSFIPIDSLLTDSSLPLCNIILTLSMDNQGRIWFGTPCSLNRLDEVGTGKYALVEYTSEDGLPDDYISNIIPDDQGNIWISTNGGISKLIGDKDEFQNFEASDGTGEYTFSEAAGFKSEEGWLFFGGFAGFTYFDPKEIKTNNYVPPIVITNFEVLNREVRVGASDILPVSINELDQLMLTFREREVTIEFAALDYKTPMKN